MTPTRHEQVDKLFHEVLKVAPDQRDEWLAQACAGDEELRQEVKSLLALSEEAETFIEVPFFKAAHEASAQRQAQIITRKTKYCPQCQQRYPTTHRLCPQDGSLLSLKDPYKLVGRTLAGKYRLDALVGVGGMGAVYCAYHAGINRRLAVKILLPHLALQNERALEMFENEAKTIGQLNHENIADVKDAGRTAEGVAYLVMEWLDGHTLEQELADSGPLELGRIADILRQISAALDTAHAQRIIHRDLKPSNVMLIKRTDGREQVKVLDFGIAKVLDNTAGSTVSQVMGTPHYASPEQLDPGGQINTRSDIYSLGVMLYQMLTGKLPFDAPSIQELMQLHLSAPPPSVREHRPGASMAIEELVSRMLAKNPSQRPQQAGEATRSFEIALCAFEGLQAESAKVAIDDATTLTMGQDAHQAAKRRAATSRLNASPATEALRTRLGKVVIFKFVGAALALLILATTGIYFHGNRPPVMTDKDTILLTDFVNTTGDPVFDGALKQGLAVQLGQSPFLNIFSDERIRETLRFMGRSPDEPVTPTIGREICQRVGIKAMLTGSIASLGRNYVISLAGVNGQNGEALAREQGEAEGKEQVLRSLGELATRLREKLGESLSSIQRFDVPFVQATTPSLEALKFFALGYEQHRRGNHLEAIPLYQRAIELDPSFAYAYVNLGLMYSRNSRQELVNEFMTKAFELRDRTSERERLRISHRYYLFVTGEIGKASEAALMWKQLYPRDPTPYHFLGHHYRGTGQFEKAVEELRESARLQLQQTASRYELLALALTGLNRFEEAKAIGEQAITQKFDSIYVHTNLYNIAFIRGDTAAMQQQVDWASGRSAEGDHLVWQAETASFAGQFRKAHELSNRRAELAQQLGLKEAVGEIISSNAEWAAIMGHCQQCRADLKRAAAWPRIPKTIFSIGVAFALCGDITEAQSLSDEAVKQYPKNTFVNEIYLPLIRAAIEIQRGNYTQAIQILQVARSYESVSFYYQNYLRGQAYLGERKGAEAAAEFQRILDNRGWEPRFLLYPLAYLGLGRAAAISGDTTKARKAYEDFFALWKDADTDLPILLAAKREYAKLK